MWIKIAAMDDRATLHELRQKYFVDGRWEDLADVLERAIPLAEDREERLELYEELGTVCVEHLRDADRAFEALRVIADLRDDWSEEAVLEVFEQVLAFAPHHWPSFQRVERILRERGDDESLKTLAAHYIDLAGAVVDDHERFLRHQREAARIFEQDLGSPDSALVVLVTSLTTRTWMTGILEDIERLMAATGNTSEPIDKLKEVIALMTDGPRTGRLHKRLGFWCLQTGLGDDAIFHLRSCLDHFPEDREAHEALERLYRVEGRWEDIVGAVRAQWQLADEPGARASLLTRLMDVLEEAAVDAFDPADRGQYLAELGHLHGRELNDHNAAVRYFERALNAEPATLDAARPLIDHYMDRNRWERAAPVLETVVKVAQTQRGVLDPHEENRRWLQYAEVLDRVGNEKLALHAYRQAYEIDRNNPHTLQRLGLLLYEAEEFDQAYHVFVQLADRHYRAINADVLADVLRKAAAIKSFQGDNRTAMGFVERALRISPEDRETLKLAADIAAAEGDISLSMRARKRLVESEANPVVKFKDLVDMGDRWGSEGDWERAAHSYVKALDLEPESVSVLRKLLEAFQKIGRWRESVGVLERLAHTEKDRIRRAKLFYTMGIICRDEIRSPQRAVHYLDCALDEDTELLKAFEAIDRILTDRRAWKELERAYRRMLHRVSENELGLDDATRQQLDRLLWTNLGEVYRSRLKDVKAAIKAYEIVLAMDREDEKTQLIIAELYERAGIDVGGTVQQYRKLLAKDPMRGDAHLGVFRALMSAREYDAAHCVAGVLDWMGRGDRESDEYYATYIGRNLRLMKGKFYPELFDRVYPRGQNRVVNGVMAHLAVALRESVAMPHKDFGVHTRDHRIDEKKDPSVLAQMFRYTCDTMGTVPMPEMYARVDHPLGMRALNVDPTAILVGSDVLALTNDDRSLAFRLAKLMAWMRPEHYLAAIGNIPGQLQVMFISAQDFVMNRKPTAGRDGAQVIKILKGAPQQTKLQLSTLMNLYMKHADAPPDMTQWVTEAEKATTRFGLLFCGDFRKAIQNMDADAQPPTTSTREERVTDLVEFATSDDYFEARAELGLSITDR